MFSLVGERFVVVLMIELSFELSVVVLKIDRVHETFS